MSCNQPLYQGLLGAVKDTWAKPIIQNSIPNVQWFGYTSCDSHHPKPVVDFEEHMIYVDVVDDVYHTYEKTQKAYDMIKNILDFDYVIRTNTSVFVNLKNMFKKMSTISEDEIWGRHQYNEIRRLDDGKILCSFWLIHGFFFGMKKEYFDMCMTIDREFINRYYGEQFTECYDDTLISLMIYEKFGENYPSTCIEMGDEDRITSYKPYIKEDKDLNMERVYECYNVYQDEVYDNPEIINDRVMVKVRSIYSNEKRSYKGCEVEHMYELYNVLK